MCSLMVFPSSYWKAKNHGSDQNCCIINKMGKIDLFSYKTSSWCQWNVVWTFTDWCTWNCRTQPNETTRTPENLRVKFTKKFWLFCIDTAIKKKDEAGFVASWLKQFCSLSLRPDRLWSSESLTFCTTYALKIFEVPPISNLLELPLQIY